MPNCFLNEEQRLSWSINSLTSEKAQGFTRLRAFSITALLAVYILKNCVRMSVSLLKMYEFYYSLKLIKMWAYLKPRFLKQFAQENWIPLLKGGA